MIQIHAFKENEKERGEGRPQLGGQWKVPSLVDLRMFHVWWSMGKNLTWWPMEGFNVWWPLDCSMFGGQWGNILFGGQWKVLMFNGPWKVSSLMAYGRKRKNIIFTCFYFPLTNLLKPYFINFKVYFTMVLNHYFMYFLIFPWPINYNHTSLFIKSFTHSSPNWF